MFLKEKEVFSFNFLNNLTDYLNVLGLFLWGKMDHGLAVGFLLHHWYLKTKPENGYPMDTSDRCRSLR